MIKFLTIELAWAIAVPSGLFSAGWALDRARLPIIWAVGGNDLMANVTKIGIGWSGQTFIRRLRIAAATHFCGNTTISGNRRLAQRASEARS
jgi:hypothetical protein